MPEQSQVRPASQAPEAALLSDESLVGLARSGDAAAFELLMRRHNQRVYRVVRSVLREDSEVEDVMQQSYLSAFAHLDQFAGTAQWSTWLCRIAINEAIARKRQRNRRVSSDEVLEEAVTDLWRQPSPDPERLASGRELRRLVEDEVDRLPESLRAVLMMREIEGMNTAETAAVLDLTEDVVKTRLHRARVCLREHIERRLGGELDEAFAFGAERCDRVVAGVLARRPGRADVAVSPGGAR